MAAGASTEPVVYTDEEHWIGGKQDLCTVGDRIGSVCLGEVPTPKGWWLTFIIGFLLMQGMVVGLA